MPDALARWRSLLDDLTTMGETVLADLPVEDERLAIDGLRYLLRFAAAGIETCVEAEDRDAPELRHHIEPGRTWGLDNPDCRYRVVAIDPSGTYELRGDPGSCTRLELQVNTGHLGDGDFAGWRSVSRLDDRSMVRDPDGSVRIVVSADRPPGTANWLATTADATYVQVREYVGDWESERPSNFSVSRVDVPLPHAPLTATELDRRLALLSQWLTAGSRCWVELATGLARSEPGSIQPFVPPAAATGLGGQAYGMGGFRCEPEEAVILEVAPPACRYWSISLSSWFWESPDVADRQCSLNHTQAVVDGDGVARVVIAHHDPGVANWLDPGGHRAGTIALRYLDAADLPPLTQRRVPLETLDAHLPAGTRRITLTERQAVLERRRAALARRYLR